MKTKTLAILSLWRDSASYIERSLAQFQAMESQLDVNCVYGFFENDSQDNTAEHLQSWLKTHTGFVISERIGAPKWGSVASLERVRYQARYRNIVLDYFLDYYNFDYLLVADSDVRWEPDLIKQMIDRLDKNPTWGMVSPNTVQNVRDCVGDTELPSYFDSWSLVDSEGNQGMTFAANPFLNENDRNKWKQKQPVSCNSAFGSIAMVSVEALLPDDESPDASVVHWNVVDGVEHWEFCKGIRNNGYLVIADPSLHAEIIHNKEVVPHPDIVKMHQQRLTDKLHT